MPTHGGWTPDAGPEREERKMPTWIIRVVLAVLFAAYVVKTM